MSRRQRRTAPHSWDGGGIRGRAISPGASYDRERSGAGSASLFRSFASSVSELESTATLGAAAPEEEEAGEGAAGGDGDVVRELIQELKDTQQMVQQMEQRMEEQDEDEAPPTSSGVTPLTGQRPHIVQARSRLQHRYTATSPAR